jgi:hypothetical protein
MIRALWLKQGLLRLWHWQSDALTTNSNPVEYCTLCDKIINRDVVLLSESVVYVAFLLLGRLFEHIHYHNAILILLSKSIS